MIAEAICLEFVGPVKEHKGVMRLVASAYRIASKCGDVVYMTLMYMMKSSGPNMEPWGTPVSMLAREDVTLFIWVYCFLFSKYDLNHFKGVCVSP